MMKAKKVYETLDFERGKEPKEALGVGREARKEYEFMTYFDAIDWAIRNLELITDDKYSPNNPIRRVGTQVIPEDLIEYFTKWADKVTLTGYEAQLPEAEIQTPILMQEFGLQLKKHGILTEGIDFERGKDPKTSMGIGSVKKISDLFELLFIADSNSGYKIGGGDPIDNMKRSGKLAMIKFFTNPLRKPGSSWDQSKEEYIKMLLEQIGVRHLIKDYSLQPGSKARYYFEFNDHAEKIFEESYPNEKWFNRWDYSISESVNFKRGMDPKKSMGIGHKEYIKSLDWGFSRQFIDQILDDETLEIVSYKGFTILLTKEIYNSELVVHNPWNSDDIWIAMANSRPEIPIRDASPRSRAPGKTKALSNVKRQINYHLKKAGVSESVSFERGKDPIDALKIGIKERLKDEAFSLKSGWTPGEVKRISSIMGVDADDIYQMGFAGEWDYDKYEFNEWTQKLDDLTPIKGAFKKEIYKKDGYYFYNFPMGKIVKVYLDEEGIYWYGDATAAINLDLINVPRDDRESMK